MQGVLPKLDSDPPPPPPELVQPKLAAAAVQPIVTSPHPLIPGHKWADGACAASTFRLEAPVDTNTAGSASVAARTVLPATYFLPPAGKPSRTASAASHPAGPATPPWALHVDESQMQATAEARAGRLLRERQAWAAAQCTRPSSPFARNTQKDLCAADAMWFDQAAPLLHSRPACMCRPALGRYRS
jgi:hypothetical protein